MLAKFIMRLRRQSKAMRDKLALGVAASFTALVAFVWISSQVTVMSPDASVASVVEGAPVFSGFVDGLRERVDGFGAVGETWETLVTGTTTSASSTPEIDGTSTVMGSSTIVFMELSTDVGTSSGAYASVTPTSTGRVVRIATTTTVSATTAATSGVTSF